jgi:hypothetical protein
MDATASSAGEMTMYRFGKSIIKAQTIEFALSHGKTVHCYSQHGYYSVKRDGMVNVVDFKKKLEIKKPAIIIYDDPDEIMKGE